MANEIAKYVSIAALLAAVLLRGLLDYRVVLAFAICWGAIVMVRQAALAQKYIWASAFTLIAILFNPVWMVRFPAMFSLWLDVICLTAFAASLLLLKFQPKLSMPSITDRTPGSESL